jgi:hypothetical protein
VETATAMDVLLHPALSDIDACCQCFRMTALDEVGPSDTRAGAARPRKQCPALRVANVKAWAVALAIWRGLAPNGG